MDTLRSKINQKVNNAATILQIKDLLERKPKQLSGGQRQRVAIGRAIGNFHPMYGGETHEFASAEEMQKWQENQNITNDDGSAPQFIQSYEKKNKKKL